MSFHGRHGRFNNNQSFQQQRHGKQHSTNTKMACQQYYNDNDSDRVFIHDLNPGPVKKKICGLVIAKYEARSFPDKKNIGQMRYSCSFVIRDSPVDFLSVTCWGQEEFIRNITESFKVGDAVELDNCMVQTKQNNDYEERYRPSTTSPFQLTVNEQHSKVSQFSGSDMSEFNTIAYLPVKDNNDYYTLDDVITNGHNLNGTNLNIVAVVKDPGIMKDITTKTGRSMKRREVKLFDDTCLSFPLIIWDAEVGELAETWTSRESVLFLSDVKVSFEEFRQKMVATCTSKTIIITNPDTPEAHHLFNYAQSMTAFNDDPSVDAHDEVNISSIQDVFTLYQLKEKLSTSSSVPHQRQPFYGIAYACISTFDIDGHQSGIATRCSSCRRRVNRMTMECVNTSCAGDRVTSRSFEIRLSLSDHTLGLDNFNLSSSTAERILGCDVDSFTGLDDLKKTELKWKFLFERFKVYFKIIPATQERTKPYFSIIDLQPIDVRAFLQNEQ